MKKLKIIFAGTANFSEKHLSALIKYNYNIIAVITQPDRPFGRGQKIIFSPVKQLAIKNNLPVLQPLNLNNEKFYKIILNFQADIMIVVAYGKIIPQIILSIFKKGCINVHASLLPRWRGPTPIQSAILFGDKKTGISVIKMNDKVDSGDIITSNECEIKITDTTKKLSNKLSKLGIQTLLDALYKIDNNIDSSKKQNEQYATFSKKILKKEALLNSNKNAKFLERLIRAFNPWPICYFVLNNIHIKVWQASIIKNGPCKNTTGRIISINKKGIQIETKQDILNIEKIQFPGKNILNIQQIITSNKNNFKIGKILF
ncbi:Methionyl-tRNA formyltransferase [Buchnera aphidicola (Protaphis terricola)]|uniref:methionyl-tRNA formyltransferase n=1 Tax=Buchnera aphidicola TaxID=9 RepID=UPI0034643C9E